MRYWARFNHYVMKWMPVITPTCLVLGILLEPLIGRFIFLVPWLFAFMTFEGSLRSNFNDVKKVLLHPLPILSVLLILHLVMPLLAWAAGNIFFADNPSTITGIILMFLAPTGISSLMWVTMYRGNGSMALSLILLDTLLTPLTLPLSLRFLAHSSVSFDVLSMMQSLLFMIAIPAVLAMLVNQITKGKVETTVAPQLTPLSKIAMMMVITLNSTKMAPLVKQMNMLLLTITLTVFILVVTGYIIGWLCSRLLKLKREDRIAMTLNSGMRNISTGAVIAAQYFPGEVMFPVMVSTLFQQLLATIVTSLFEKFK